MRWTQVLIGGAVLGGLLVGTACESGGEDPAAAEPEDGKAKKRKGKEPVPEKPRPPAKFPRPPFLSLPDEAGVAEAKELLSKHPGRTLAFAAQRGPFGGRETVLVVWTESVEGVPTVGGAVISGTTAQPLPFDNALPVDSASEVVWASSERGWEAVVLIRRLDGDTPVQANQVFAWDGAGFVRDLDAEAKVATFTSPDAIRQALL